MLFQPLVDRSLLAVSSLSLASTGAEPAGSSVELDKRGGGGGVYQHGSGGGGDYSQSGLEGKHKLGFGHHSPHKQRKGHGHGYTHDKSPHHQHYPPWWQRRRPSKHQCRAKHCPCPPHTKAVCKHGKCAFECDHGFELHGHKCIPVRRCDPHHCPDNVPYSHPVCTKDDKCGSECDHGYVLKNDCCVEIKVHVNLA